MRPLTSAGTLAVVMTIGLACGPSTMPIEEPGTFVLREIQGDPLPAALYTNEVVSIIVISDTIQLNGDGTGTISGVRASEPVQPTGLPQPPSRSSADILFHRVDDRIEIRFVCPPDADCFPPPHLIGIEQGSRLEVTWAPGQLGRSPMTYTRVD